MRNGATLAVSVVLLITGFCTCKSQTKKQVKQEVLYRTKRCQRVKTGSIGYQGFWGDIGRDVVSLHKNLFTWSSYKTIVASFPLYIATRMADEYIQSKFYCEDHHKNYNQMPSWCRAGAKWGIAVPMATLGSLAFLSSSEDIRMTSRVFLTGMPFVIFGKDILKKMKIRACLRPKCEFFCKHNRAYGGCPSGHMAEAAYMLTLYGLRYGAKFAAPLSAVAAFVAIAFINCNRHYSSQIVAGAALGTAYALAAYKVVSKNLESNISIDVACNLSGGTGLRLVYKF